MSTPTWEPTPGPDDQQQGGQSVPDPYAAPAPAGPPNPYGAAPTSAYGGTPYPQPGTAGTPYAGGYQGGAYPSDPYQAGTYQAGTYPGGAAPGAAYPGSPYAGTPYAGTSYTTGPYAGGWAPVPRTEPLATASMVTSLAGLIILITAPVGLVLGIVAARRINRNGTQGRGMAVTGIVVGAVLTVVLIMTVAWWVYFAAAFGSGIVSDSSYSDYGTSSGSGSGSGTTDAQDQQLLPDYTLSIDLAPGTCLADAPMEYDMSDAVQVDCTTTHDTEVLASLTLSAPVQEDLLVPDAAYTEAVASCTDLATTTLAAVGPLDSIGYIDFYYPHPDQWDSGGRSGYCVLVTDDWVTGSALAGTLGAGAASDV